MDLQSAEQPRKAHLRRNVRPVIGTRLRKLLFAVFGLFALLAINSVYLVTITLIEWGTDQTYQDYFY